MLFGLHRAASMLQPRHHCFFLYFSIAPWRITETKLVVSGQPASAAGQPLFFMEVSVGQKRGNVMTRKQHCAKETYTTFRRVPSVPKTEWISVWENRSLSALPGKYHIDIERFLSRQIHLSGHEPARYQPYNDLREEREQRSPPPDNQRNYCRYRKEHQYESYRDEGDFAQGGYPPKEVSL